MNRRPCRFVVDPLVLSLRPELGCDGSWSVLPQCFLLLGQGIPVVPLVSVLPPLLSAYLVCLLQFLQCPLDAAGADLDQEFPFQLVP